MCVTRYPSLGYRSSNRSFLGVKEASCCPQPARLPTEAAAQLLGLDGRQVFRLLKADRTDGRMSWGRTALRDVDRCVGDIGDMDGQLACNRGDRGYGWSQYRDYGQSPAYDGYGYDRYGVPGYGSSGDYWRYRGGWPPAGYPSDYGR